MKKNSSILVNKNLIDSIAIGGFDGMHLAHQELFKKLSKNGAILSIETGYANLTPKHYRQEYTSLPIFNYDLDEIRHLNALDFIKLLKNDFINLKKIVVGFDFCFGKDRAYSSEVLKDIFEGEVIVIPEIKLDDFAIHSRYIRNFIKEGQIKKANSFLGRKYKIYGENIQGQGLGKKELFATINLKIADFLLPKNGVYLTKTILDEKEYKSLTFIGNRVSTDGNFSVETHILDEDIEIKNKIVQIKFFDFLRENKKFENLENLKKQISVDINKARKYFINF